MFQELEKIALLLALFVITIGVAYLFSLEQALKQERKERERNYQMEMNRSKLRVIHTENKIPAYNRFKKI